MPPAQPTSACNSSPEGPVLTALCWQSSLERFLALWWSVTASLVPVALILQSKPFHSYSGVSEPYPVLKVTGLKLKWPYNVCGTTIFSMPSLRTPFNMTPRRIGCTGSPRIATLDCLFCCVHRLHLTSRTPTHKPPLPTCLSCWECEATSLVTCYAFPTKVLFP